MERASERVSKILESETFRVSEDVRNDLGYGTLPSICPSCKAPLDFGRIGQDELICRKQCGWRFE